MIRAFHVVIVDDEPVIRRGLARIVEQHEGPWKVLGTFENGREALDFMQRSSAPVDLLITDVKMPEMDGLRLIREAKRFHRFLPLVISGYDDFEYVRLALKEGAFDYILKPIDRQQIRRQLNEIAGKLRRQRRQEELVMLRQLMAGYSYEAASRDWRELFPAAEYRLCGVSVDEPPHKMRVYSERDWELLLYALGNIVEEAVNERTRQQAACGWTWQDAPRHYWMLLGGMEGTEEAEELAEFVRSASRRHLGLTVTVAVSAAFDDLLVLPNMRNDVLSLLYLRLVYGGNRVFSADRLLDASEPALSAVLNRIGRRIIVAIRHDSPAETRRLLKEIFRDLETLRTPQAIEQAVQYMLLQIVGAWLETDPAKGKRLLVSDFANIHAYASSFARLSGKMEEWVTEVSAAVREKRRGTENDPTEKAKAWIRRNLSAPLTIPAVAGQIPMNPTYFCEIFKAQTGETVLDYITRQRMEEAARLLIETSAKLADIAEKVGYRDVKYFSRQFKKHFGVLPSRYKEFVKESGGGDGEKE